MLCRSVSVENLSTLLDRTGPRVLPGGTLAALGWAAVMEADLCIRLMHLVGILQALGSAAVTCVVYEDAVLFLLEREI